MAKDFLNVIERALMMGISDVINTAVTGDVHVYGEFPETEDLKFPAIIVQHTGSGFEEQLMGQKQTFGGAVGKGEIYGVAYSIHVITEKDTEITIEGTVYKQRRLLNWMMLNIANAFMDIDWSIYQEEELEIQERILESWRGIGFINELKWYGATADIILTFNNFRD
jgi:hypothetical protein